MKKRISVVLYGVSCAISFFLGNKMLVGMVNDYKAGMDRNLANASLLNDWLSFVYAGKDVSEYFHKRGYKKIMIYGAGNIGIRLEQALSKTDITVSAVMDRSAPSDGDGPTIGVAAEIPDVDCIVITPVSYYDEIFNMLRGRTDIPIVSIETIIEVSD